MSSNFYSLGLVGHPVSHSLSPCMHRAALSHLGLRGDYRLFDLSPGDLSSGIERLRLEGLSGFNVTVPHKESVASLCTELTREANDTGAVNTVLIDRGRRVLIGHNTDVGGFAAALADSLSGGPERRYACVLGAGGAARAAVLALSRLGFFEIRIAARNIQAGETLRRRIIDACAGDPGLAQPSILVSDTALELLDQGALVVNCTTVGMANEALPEWLESILQRLGPDGAVFDMVYSRSGPPTSLVAAAESAGIPAWDGSEMLVRQAALAFTYWTGMPAPVNVMREALNQARVAS